MNRFPMFSRLLLALSACLLTVGPAAAQSSFPDVAKSVNTKMVKVHGSGGFQRLTGYGTGLIVSADGYVLTANTTLLGTPDLRVYLPDGRRFDQLTVVVAEPELDVALIKLKDVEDLPFFDIAQAAKRTPGQPGDWVLAFSNQFRIAEQDEPMTVQRGAIASYAKLDANRGVHESPYRGDVYFVDAITNNPGAAGGALTTRKGELLGIVGRELRSTKTNTWVNYAIPVQAKVTIADEKGENKVISLAEFVSLGMQGKYKPVERKKTNDGPKAFHGIVLVPNVVPPRTPPFVEDVVPGSPAAKAGLKPDDLIAYIDGENVVSIDSFLEVMNRIPPGTPVTLEVKRSGSEKTHTVKLTTEKPLPVKTPPKKKDDKEKEKTK